MLGFILPETVRNQHFLKGGRRPTFSRILGVHYVLDGLPHLGQTVRDFLHSGKTVQDFLCLGRTVQDFLRTGSPKWVLGQFGPETVRNQHFLKGILKGSRRLTFSRILGVQSVLDGLTRLGQTGRDFLHSGKTVQDFLCLGRIVQDFLRTGSPKFVLGKFGPETAQNQHFLKGILIGSRRPTFSRILALVCSGG